MPSRRGLEPKNYSADFLDKREQPTFSIRLRNEWEYHMRIPAHQLQHWSGDASGSVCMISQLPPGCMPALHLIVVPIFRVPVQVFGAGAGGGAGGAAPGMPLVHEPLTFFDESPVFR
jgi:hypothetical protein